MLFSKDKLHLSAEAMKVVAKALVLPDEEGGSPRAAIMSGLRYSHEPRYCVLDSRPRFKEGENRAANLHRPMIFVSGDRGVGKTHLIRSWLRIAATKGYRSLILSRKATAGWTSADATTFDAPADERELGGVCAALRAVLDRGEASHIHFSMMPYPQNHALYRAAVRKILTQVMSEGREDLIVAVDDFDWSDDMDLLDQISAYIEKRNLRFITTAFRTASLPAERFSVAPTEVRMASIHTSDRFFKSFNRLELKRGEAIVGDNEEDLFTCYNDLNPSPSSCLTPAALRAIEHLRRTRPKWREGSHTDRLEAVARACGYRSWHAAQGRRDFYSQLL